MSAEASGPAAAAEAPALEEPKPPGLEPGPGAPGLRPLTPNSKYVKLNVGGSLHYTTLRTLTAQDTLLKAMFSGRAEVLTDAGGTRAALRSVLVRNDLILHTDFIREDREVEWKGGDGS